VDFRQPTARGAERSGGDTCRRSRRYSKWRRRAGCRCHWDPWPFFWRRVCLLRGGGVELGWGW
jgi:hypothetical protein